MSRKLLFLVVILLAFVPAWFERSEGRALSPLDELRADLEWVHFQRARIAGDSARAVRHARLAIERNPKDTGGWELFSAYLGYELASASASSDEGTRRAWFEAALACTEEGEAQANEPRRLTLTRALLCWNKAVHDPGVAVSGGARALYLRAAAIFEAAEEPGLAETARQRAEDL